MGREFSRQEDGRFRDAILAVYPDATSIWFYNGSRNGSFTIEHGNITFDKIASLAERFHTKNINFHFSQTSSGCPTCGHGSSSEVEVAIKDVAVDWE